MSDNLLVETAFIILSVDLPATAIPFIPPVNLLVSSSGKINIDGLKVALATDMGQQAPLSFGYAKAAYVGGVLAWDGKLNGYDVYEGLKKDDAGVITDANGGTVTFNVFVPAQQPAAPSPIPDASISYDGTCSISVNPNNKFSVR